VDHTQTAAPKGVIVNTRPPAGATLPPGGRVTLVVSVGAPTLTVPDVRGLTLEEARAILEQTGLTLGTYFRRTSEAPPGTIIHQTPAPGTLSASGAAVDLILARRGP
jgi:serine/threonine-protein kinase